MSIYKNLSNYFDEDSRTILKAGVAAWRHLLQHEDWNNWLRVGEAIARAQDIAADVTGQTSGKSFNAFMTQCYAMPSYLGEFGEIDKAARSHAVKCWRNREAIEKWRQSIGQAKAMSMSHPAVVWRNYEASRRPPSAPAPVDSPFARTKTELAKALEEVDKLKKVNDALRRPSRHDVTFSLRDTPAAIAAVLRSELGDRLPSVLTALKKGATKS